MPLTLEPEEELRKEPKASYLPVLTLVIGIVVFSALVGGIKTFAPKGTPVTSSIVANQIATDNVSPQMRTAIEAKFMTYTAHLKALDPHDSEIQKMVMAAPYLQKNADAILSMAQKDEIQIGAITLWDNFAEDGDAIQVVSSGTSLSVTLKNAPQVFYIPFHKGIPIRIIGLRDGDGNGITAAIETESGSVPLPVLTVGQVIDIPVF